MHVSKFIGPNKKTQVVWMSHYINPSVFAFSCEFGGEKKSASHPPPIQASISAWRLCIGSWKDHVLMLPLFKHRNCGVDIWNRPPHKYLEYAKMLLDVFYTLIHWNTSILASKLFSLLNRISFACPWVHNLSPPTRITSQLWPAIGIHVFPYKFPHHHLHLIDLSSTWNLHHSH